MVYQEQVSRIVNRLGGVELKAAFRLAKAISKKKTSMIEAMREPFLNGCVANGVTRPVAEQVFEDILKFGGYAFNKAHSTGYALVAYQTAWMKTYFPLEFMAAVLCLEMSSTEKIAEYREECSAMRIVLEPPDVNRSTYEFVVEKVAGATADQGRRGSLRSDLVRSAESARRPSPPWSTNAIAEDRSATSLISASGWTSPRSIAEPSKP